MINNFLTMAHDALLEIFEDIDVFLDEWLSPNFKFAKKGELFERFVEKLFKRLPGWTVKRQGDSSNPDQGSDLIAISPHGIRYIVQLKHYTAAKPSGPDVSHTYSAMALHGGHHCILCTSFKVESGGSPFTKDAQDRARQLGVKLWGRDELALLYRAAEQPYLLRELELDHRPVVVEAPPPPKPIKVEPEPLPKPEAPPAQPVVTAEPTPATSSSWLLELVRHWWVLLLVVVGLLLAQYLLFSLSHRAVRQTLLGFDQAYRYALNTNDTSRLRTFATDDFIRTRVQLFVDRRRKDGCVLLTQEQEAPKFVRVWVDRGTAVGLVKKNWKQTLVCRERENRVVLDKDFEITYRLAKQGGWKVVESSGN